MKLIDEIFAIILGGEFSVLKVFWMVFNPLIFWISNGIGLCGPQVLILFCPCFIDAGDRGSEFSDCSILFPPKNKTQVFALDFDVFNFRL